MWQIEVTNDTDAHGGLHGLAGSVRDGRAYRDRLGLALRRALDGGQLPRLHDAGAHPRLHSSRPAVPARTRPAAAAPGQAAAARHPARRGHRDRCRWRTNCPGTSARTPSTRTGDSAAATVRRICCRDGDRPILFATAEIALDPASEVTLGSFELRAGQVVELELRLDDVDQTGVVLTHGNHPDSLQLGVDAGRLWFGIAGEKEYADRDLVAGRWYADRASRSDGDRVAMSLDGEPVAATGHWSASPRWKSLIRRRAGEHRGRLLAGPCVSYAFDTEPESLTELGAGARATWSLRLEPGQTRTIGVVCAYGDDCSDVAAAASAAASRLRRHARRIRSTAGASCGAARSRRGIRTSAATCRCSRRPIRASRSRTIWALLLALYMRNTRISDTEPIFLTGGPRLGADDDLLLGSHRVEPALRAARTGRSPVLAAPGAEQPVRRVVRVRYEERRPAGQRLRLEPLLVVPAGRALRLHHRRPGVPGRAGRVVDRVRASRPDGPRLARQAHAGHRRHPRRLRRGPVDAAGVRAELRQRGGLVQRGLRRHDALVCRAARGGRPR